MPFDNAVITQTSYDASIHRTYSEHVHVEDESRTEKSPDEEQYNIVPYPPRFGVTGGDQLLH